MKKKNSILIYQLIIMGVLLMPTSSCKKDDQSNLTNGKTMAVFNSNLTYGTMTDQDGNIYKIITIGAQTWMAENLRTTKYRNGESIPKVTENAVWSDLSTGAYCNYENTKNNDTIATYGRLYNWYAVSDNRNIAPTGWHVPTDAEWTTLENYLIENGYNYDSTTTDNKIAKALASASGWNSSTVTGAPGNADYSANRNETGFTALPGGGRYSGAFSNMGFFGFWWSSTEYNTYYAWSRQMYCYNSGVYRYDDYGQRIGFSVRCLKD